MNNTNSNQIMEELSDNSYEYLDEKTGMKVVVNYAHKTTSAENNETFIMDLIKSAYLRKILD